MATVSNTTTGLNANKIDKMQQVFTDYINNVTKKIDINATKAEIQKAIKGSASESTLIKMNQAIDNAFGQYLKQLKQYRAILTNMKTSYNYNDSNNASFSDVTKGLNK